MKNKKEIWAQIINDARFYDGTPQMLVQITEHFATHYTIAQKLKQPDVSGELPLEQYPDTEADGIVFCGKCGGRNNVSGNFR